MEMVALWRSNLSYMTSSCRHTVFRKVIVHWKREGIFYRGHLFPKHKTADKIQIFFEKHELLLKPEPRSGLNSWQQINPPKNNSNTYYYFPFNLVKHMILILSFCEFVLLLFIINVIWSISLFLLFYFKVIVHWKREGIFYRGHLFPKHKTADKIQTFFWPLTFLPAWYRQFN
jgi:hypothetical protein